MDHSHQAPLSMGILQVRILEWVAMPSSRDPPDLRIEPASPISAALEVDSLPAEPWGKALRTINTALFSPSSLCEAYYLF